MHRHFGRQQSDSLRTSGLAKVSKGEARALARMHGRAVLKVGQGEGRAAVPAVGGAQQRTPDLPEPEEIIENLEAGLDSFRKVLAGLGKVA